MISRQPQNNAPVGEPAEGREEGKEANTMPEKRKRQDGPINEATAKEREVENYARLLDKLPQEVWEKIFDILDEDNLFPLALSCRYFRQKQKELVERTEQSGKPCLTLKTNLKRKLDEGQPASAEYLRLCSDLAIYDLQTYINSDNHEDTDKAEEACTRSMLVACLAAVYGHLPLLQDHFSEDGPCYINQRGFQIFGPAIAKNAGESSSPQSLHLCFGF